MTREMVNLIPAKLRVERCWHNNRKLNGLFLLPGIGTWAQSGDKETLSNPYSKRIFPSGGPDSSGGLLRVCQISERC